LERTCFNETKVVYYVDTDVIAELPSLKTLIGGWLTQTTSMWIASILLEEKMGVKVDFWPTDVEDYNLWYEEYDIDYPVTQYQWLADGSIDFIAECWEITRYRDEVKEVFQGGEIKEAGNLGTIGQFYIFVPEYTMKKNMGIGWYESLFDEDVIEIFREDMIEIFDKYKNQTDFFTRYVNWTDDAGNRFSPEAATIETNQTRPFILGAKHDYQMNMDL